MGHRPGKLWIRLYVILGVAVALLLAMGAWRVLVSFEPSLRWDKDAVWDAYLECKLPPGTQLRDLAWSKSDWPTLLLLSDTSLGSLAFPTDRNPWVPHLGNPWEEPTDPQGHVHAASVAWHALKLPADHRPSRLRSLAPGRVLLSSEHTGEAPTLGEASEEGGSVEERHQPVLQSTPTLTAWGGSALYCAWSELNPEAITVWRFSPGRSSTRQLPLPADLDSLVWLRLTDCDRAVVVCDETGKAVALDLEFNEGEIKPTANELVRMDLSADRLRGATLDFGRPTRGLLALHRPLSAWFVAATPSDNIKLPPCLYAWTLMEDDGSILRINPPTACWERLIGRFAPEWRTVSTGPGAINLALLRTAGEGRTARTQLWVWNPEQRGRLLWSSSRKLEHIAWSPNGWYLAASDGQRVVIFRTEPPC